MDRKTPREPQHENESFGGERKARPDVAPVARLAATLVDDLGRANAIALCRNNHWDGVLRAIGGRA